MFDVSKITVAVLHVVADPYTNALHTILKVRVCCIALSNSISPEDVLSVVDTIVPTMLSKHTYASYPHVLYLNVGHITLFKKSIVYEVDEAVA